MITVVVVLVAIAAAQGLYNILKEAKHDFDLIDPTDVLPSPALAESMGREDETRRAA